MDDSLINSVKKIDLTYTTRQFVKRHNFFRLFSFYLFFFSLYQFLDHVESLLWVWRRLRYFLGAIPIPCSGWHSCELKLLQVLNYWRLVFCNTCIQRYVGCFLIQMWTIYGNRLLPWSTSRECIGVVKHVCDWLWRTFITFEDDEVIVKRKTHSWRNFPWSIPSKLHWKRKATEWILVDGGMWRTYAWRWARIGKSTQERLS